MNPSTMSVNEIAAQATTAQIIDGINRAQQALMTGTNTEGWAKMHAKLNEALRIKLTPNRAIQAPAATYRPRHRSHRVELAGVERDGLARYVGARI